MLPVWDERGSENKEAPPTRTAGPPQRERGSFMGDVEVESAGENLGVFAPDIQRRRVRIRSIKPSRARA